MEAPKILVIDDEELITKTFSRFLEKRGLDVLIAKRNEDAIAFVEENDFDVIISDIRMPGQDGVQTIRQIEKVLESQKRKRPPVIFITGFSDKNMEAEAKKLDHVAFLYKPFESEELLSAINRGLKR